MLSDFGNSTKKPFDILRGLGFVVEKRELEFFEQLKMFINQAYSGELKTLHYTQSYSGLKVKVSFGQGSQARVPWIAFLGANNSVSDGIYPVYLFFKSRQLLILAYGVSETTIPSIKWNIQNTITIEEYFKNNYSFLPERYGSSYVYAAYDTSKDLDPTIINEDINQLITIYKSALTNQNIITKTESANHILKAEIVEEFDFHSFVKSLDDSGLIFNDVLCVRFIASLITKPFVILTGLAGSGKTKLVQAFAKWITNEESQVCIVPVGADWTNREPLLGFPNALDAGKYILPDNGALNLLINANNPENQYKPYFLILDEMNLSHVERYFADFLSAMESSEPIPLHTDSKDWKDQVPHNIKLPPNLFIIGTVNIDETTYMFSPKVLDRANVIEFRITRNELYKFLNGVTKVDLSKLYGKGAASSKSFLQLAIDNSYSIGDERNLNESLLAFFDELKKLGAEFGYRTAYEIKRFANIVNKLEPNWTEEQIIDAAVIQKLLPKVHGSRRKLEPVLKAIGKLCLKDDQSIDEVLQNSSFENSLDYSTYNYPMTLEKISRMQKGLVSNGFTSFSEA